MDAFTNRAREKFPLREKGDKRRGAERRPEFLMLSGASAPLARGTMENSTSQYTLLARVINSIPDSLPPSLPPSDGRTDGRQSISRRQQLSLQ